MPVKPFVPVPFIILYNTVSALSSKLCAVNTMSVLNFFAHRLKKSYLASLAAVSVLAVLSDRISQ